MEMEEIELMGSEFTESEFKELMSGMQKATGLKGKDLYMPLRLALTGKEHGPELWKIMNALGRHECMKRIVLCINHVNERCREAGKPYWVEPNVRVDKDNKISLIGE